MLAEYKTESSSLTWDRKTSSFDQLAGIQFRMSNQLIKTLFHLGKTRLWQTSEEISAGDLYVSSQSLRSLIFFSFQESERGRHVALG